MAAETYVIIWYGAGLLKIDKSGILTLIYKIRMIGLERQRNVNRWLDSKNENNNGARVNGTVKQADDACTAVGLHT